MRVFGRRISQRSVGAGADDVVVGFAIPARGSLNNVHLDVHVIGEEGSAFGSMSMYGFDGFVVPVLDPDAVVTHQTIWDNQIPKDVNFAAGALDLDTAAADTTPFFEIGTPNIEGLIDMSGTAVQRIFKRRKWLSLASGSLYTGNTGAVDVRVAVDHFSTQVRQKVRVKAPSVALFAFAVPDTLATTATEPVIPTEPQWLLLMYLEVVLEQMFMSLAGLTETGAESPYEESLAFIASLVEDSVFEETAGSFIATTFQVYTIATFDISVPGQVNVGSLTGEF